MNTEFIAHGLHWDVDVSEKVVCIRSMPLSAAWFSAYETSIVTKPHDSLISVVKGQHISIWNQHRGIVADLTNHQPQE